MHLQLGLGASLPLPSTVLELPQSAAHTPLPASCQPMGHRPAQATQSAPEVRQAAGSDSGVQLLTSLAQAFSGPISAQAQQPSSAARTTRPFSGGEGAFRPVKPVAARAAAPQPQQPSRSSLPPGNALPRQPGLQSDARASSSSARAPGLPSLRPFWPQSSLPTEAAAQGLPSAGSEPATGSPPQQAKSRVGPEAGSVAPLGLCADSSRRLARLSEPVWDLQQLPRLRHLLDQAQLKLPLPQQS